MWTHGFQYFSQWVIFHYLFKLFGMQIVQILPIRVPRQLLMKCLQVLIYIVFPLSLFFRNSVISLCSSLFTQVLFNVRFLNFQVEGFFLVSFLISSFIAEIRVLVIISIMKPTDVLCPNILVFVKVPCAFEKKVQTLLSRQ